MVKESGHRERNRKRPNKTKNKRKKQCSLLEWCAMAWHIWLNRFEREHWITAAAATYRRLVFKFCFVSFIAVWRYVLSGNIIWYCHTSHNSQHWITLYAVRYRLLLPYFFFFFRFYYFKSTPSLLSDRMSNKIRVNFFTCGNLIASLMVLFFTGKLQAKRKMVQP